MVISVNLACVSVRLRAGERHGLAAYLLLRHAIGSDLTPGGKASRLATLSEESKKRSERLPPLKSPGKLNMQQARIFFETSEIFQGPGGGGGGRNNNGGARSL